MADYKGDVDRARRRHSLAGRLGGAVWRGALRGTGLTAPADLQTLIGLAQGVSRTKSLPRDEGDAMVFDVPAGETPRALGQTVFMPQGADPETAAHEMRHATQAATVPLAPAIGTAGAMMEGAPDMYTNPLEMDAYLSQPDSPATQNDISTIRSFTKPGDYHSRLLDVLRGMHGK